jgi:hypothetical protein
MVIGTKLGKRVGPDRADVNRRGLVRRARSHTKAINSSIAVARS